MNVSTFIDEIRDVQTKLHAQSATSAHLDEAFNVHLKDEFTNKLTNDMSKDKKFYSYFLFLKYFSEHKELPIKSMSQSRDFEEKGPIPSIFNPFLKENNLSSTIKFLYDKGVLFDDLIDFITFSIVPSIFIMFIEKKYFDEFCNFINYFYDFVVKEGIKKPLHFLFARSLFVSPIFLSFIRNIMYPVFKPFCNGKLPLNCQESKPNIISDTQNELINSFKEKMFSIPSYINEFLSKMKCPKEFLKECFFSQLLKYPEAFLFIDPQLINVEEKINYIRNIIEKVLSDKVIDDIADIFVKNTLHKQAILVIPDDQSKKIVFKKLVSEMDIAFFENVSKYMKNQNTPIEVYKDAKSLNLYISLFEDEVETDGDFLHQTQVNNTRNYFPLFRKLLKDAPPIPANYKTESHDDDDLNRELFLKITKKLLVDTYDPFTEMEKKFAFYLIKECLQFDKDFDAESLMEELPNFINPHNEQSEAMGKLDNLQRSSQSLAYKKSEPLELMATVFNTTLTLTLEVKDLPAIPSLVYALENPKECAESCIKYINKLSKPAIELVNDPCKDIFISRFYQNIDFSSYCVYRSDLDKFDKMTKEVCARFISTRQVEHENGVTHESVKKAYHTMSVFQKHIISLKEAFECNTDPLTKIKTLAKAVGEFTSTFKTEFNGISADETTPFQILFVAFVNPNRYISNIVYAKEYIYPLEGEDNTYSIHLANLFEAPESLFNLFDIPTFSNFPITYLSRPSRKKLKVFVTGNDINSIFNIVKCMHDILIPQRQMPWKQMENSLKNGSLAIIVKSNQVNSTIVQNKKMKFSSTCFIIEIQYVLNIAVIEDDNFDFALFTYKNPSRNFDDRDSTDFVNSKKVSNANKVFIYNNDEFTKDNIKLGKGNKDNNIIIISIDELSDSIAKLLKKYEIH